MIALLAAAGLAGAAELAALQRTFERFPDDYQSAVALGDAALAAGDGALATTAYGRAVALSDGNFESRRGQVLALSLAGEHDAAVIAGNDLTTDFSDRPQAWAARAWAHRWRPTFPQYSAAMAAHSYTRALHLGGPSELSCGLGWSRWALGDAVGAHRVFSDADAPCGEAGMTATPQRLSVTGAAYGGGTGFAEHSWRRSGSLVGAQVGLTWSTLAGADVTVRRVGVTGESITADAVPEPGGAPPTPVAISATQSEVWLRASTRGRRVGVHGLFGSVSTTGDLESSGQLFGGRGWVQLPGVTLGVSGASGIYTDGTSVQVGGDLILPLMPAVALAGGVQHTRFVSSDALSEPRSGTSGWASVRVSAVDHRFGVELGARFGAEVRPVRMAEPMVWNLDDTLHESAFGVVSWRIDDRFTLFGGGERLRLTTPSDTASMSSTQEVESTVTTGHVGLRVTLGPTPRED